MFTRFAAWRRTARPKPNASNSCRRRTCKLWSKHQVITGDVVMFHFGRRKLKLDTHIIYFYYYCFYSNKISSNTDCEEEIDPPLHDITRSQAEESAAFLSDVRGCRSMISYLSLVPLLIPRRSLTTRTSLTCCSWRMEGLPRPRGFLTLY